MMDASGSFAERMEWRGMFLTVTADLVYYFLQSGINPTALSNRMSGDVSIGTGVLKTFGEKA